jgi:glyoxylase-like metal-dependent hydrolase (beta-lactamase superfamily II)
MFSKRLIVLWSVWVLVAGVLFGSTANEGDVVKPPEIKKFSNHVYRMTFPFKLKTNIGVSIGSDGMLLVDTGFKETVEPLRKNLAKIGGKDLKFIINTHSHGDHTSGNSIAGPNTKIISSSSLASMVAAGILKSGKGPLTGRTGKQFPRYYSMRFNGEEVRIIPAPGSHSHSDQIIHFIGSGVVHMGDLLLSQSFPAVSRNVPGYMEILDKVIDVFPEDAIFISGHGKDSSMTDVVKYRHMLRTTTRLIQEGIKQGKTADQMKKQRLLKDYEEYNHYLEWLTTHYWIDAVCAAERFGKIKKE